MVITPPVYSADDFKQAAAALLPPGEYWQYEAGEPLDNLLCALGQEFKTTHDETQLSILYPIDNGGAGWKLADYQTILGTHKITGTVSDNSATPNLIYIEIAPEMVAGELMKTLENYRLPHTAFCWTLKQKQTLHIGVAHTGLQIKRTAVVADCWTLQQQLTLKVAPVRRSVVIHRTTMRAV